MNNSFQLIRTNPRLTTNIKLVVSSDDNLYLESFDSCKELSDQKYKHKILNNAAVLENEFSKFYDNLPKKLAFSPKTEYDVDVMYNEYENQFDNTYFCGAKQVEDQWYKEEFEYFAPLYIRKNQLPKNFIILRVDDPTIYNYNGGNYELGSLTKDNFREEIINKWKCVTLFDITNKTKFGSFLDRNINKNNRFSEYSFFLDTKKYNYSKWSGWDYNSGVYTTSELFLNDKLYYENPHFNLEEFITNGFENNSIVYPYIFNIKFLFDDSPATPDKFRKYSMNRYYGFYIDKLDLIKSLTSYEFLELKSDLIIKNNIFTLNNKPVNPFKNELNKSGWIQIANNIYNVIMLNNGTFKVISDIDLTNVRSEDLNKDTCEINYTNNKNYITFNNSNFYIDPFKDSKNYNDNMYADLYLIEIDGIYHVLKNEKILNDITNTYTHTYYIQSDYAIISNNKLLKYWRGGQNNNITKNIFDNNGKPISYNIYRAKFLDIKDFDFDRIVTKYSDFDYEKSTYINTPELKLNTYEYRDNTIPMRKKIHEKNEDGQYKLMNISSEYSAGDETFELRVHNINPMWEKNQSICKWHYDGSLSHSDYSYKMNNSMELSGVYNRTTNVDITVSNIKEKTLDYFYRIGEFYGKSYNDIINGFNSDGDPEGSIDNWNDPNSGWEYSLNETVHAENQYDSGRTLIYNNDIIKNKYYYIELNVKINVTGNTSYKVGINPESFLNGLTTIIGEWVFIQFIGLSLSNKLILISDYADSEFDNLIFKEIEDKYYLNQSTNIQTKLLSKNTDNRFDLDLYIKSEFDYFEYFFNNIMYYEKDGMLLKKPYLKYSYFNGGDNDLPSTSLFKGIEYKLFKVKDMVLNQKIDGKETIRNIITDGGEYYNGYKMSVIFNENYKNVKYDKTQQDTFSNPVYTDTINTTIKDNANIIDNLSNNINIFINEKYKNMLIIINTVIPINREWFSLNNVDIFGENYGLYYGKTKDNKYNLLPLTGDSISNFVQYDPNKFIAYHFMKSLNNLNDKNVYDKYVTYYYIDQYQKLGKVIMTDFENSTTNILTNWSNNFPPFYLQVDGPLELNLKKNSYNTYPIKGPTYNIYDKYMVYSNNVPLAESIIDQPLSRYIDINNTDNNNYIQNHGETLVNHKTIKRFIGFYEPIFNNVFMYKPLYYWEKDDYTNTSIEGNYVFADDLDQFAQINELMYSKVNENGNYLKLKNVDIDTSVYPMVDEIGYSQTSRNILLSSWDKNFYIKTLNEQTLLGNYIEIPTYESPYVISAEIISVTPIGNLLGLGNPYNIYNNIYGYYKDLPSNQITYLIKVKNTSVIAKFFYLQLDYVSSVKTISNVWNDETGTIAPNNTQDITITVDRPYEIKDGMSSYSEFTNWTASVKCYEIGGTNILSSNNNLSYQVYNDLINYEVVEIILPAGDVGSSYGQGQTFNFIVKFIDTINKIDSSFTANLYLLNTIGTKKLLKNVNGTYIKSSPYTQIIFNDVTIPSDKWQTDGTTEYRELIVEIIHNYGIYDVSNTKVFETDSTYIQIRKPNAPMASLVWESITLIEIISGVCLGGTTYTTDKFYYNAIVKNTGNATFNGTGVYVTFKFFENPNIILQTIGPGSAGQSGLNLATLTIPPNGTHTFNVTIGLGMNLKTVYDKQYYATVIGGGGLPGYSISSSLVDGIGVKCPRTITPPGDGRIIIPIPGGGCFEANTLIKLSNGTIKKAAEIQIGDEIPSFHIEGSSSIEKNSYLWTNTTLNGYRTSSTVKSVIIGNSLKYYNINNGMLKSTGGHFVLILDDIGNYRWSAVSELKPGYKLICDYNTTITVKTVAVIFEQIQIVAIDVETVDNLFDFNGILSHNTLDADVKAVY